MSSLLKYLPPYVTVEKDKPQLFVVCPREKIRELAQELKEKKVKFITITGVDEGDKIAVIYHFALYPAVHGERGVIHVKVYVPKSDPKVPTISDIFPPAFLYEREVWEFLGVEFEGHPRLEYLFLSPDYPKFPLRKS